MSLFLGFLLIGVVLGFGYFSLSNFLIARLGERAEALALVSTRADEQRYGRR